MKIPGPDHPITISPNPNKVRVTVGGKVVAESARALTLKEATYPPVLYIPRADARMELLERTPHSTHCPYKGDAAYYSIAAGGPKSANAVWSYEKPFPAMAAIEGHLAFYPDRVDSIEELPAQKASAAR
jgi:uncharacterized protein (DUF427 family)